MLSTRLFIGLSMVAGLLLTLWLDERFAPWFPCWFLLAGFGMVSAARELNGLLAETRRQYLAEVRSLVACWRS